MIIDIVNMCKTLKLCHGTMTFRTTAALPPPVFDIHFEASHTTFFSVYACSIPPPLPAVSQFKYLMNWLPLQPAVYHGHNVFHDLVKFPERFRNVTSK